MHSMGLKRISNNPLWLLTYVPILPALYSVHIYIYILYVHSGQIIIIHWSEIRLLIGIVTPTNHHYSENSEVVIICPMIFLYLNVTMFVRFFRLISPLQSTNFQRFSPHLVLALHGGRWGDEAVLRPGGRVHPGWTRNTSSFMVMSP